MHTDTEFEPVTRGGRPWLRHVATGREIPVVCGGSEPDDGDSGDSGEGGKPPVEEAKLTQAQVDAIVAREKAKAQKAADKAAAEAIAAAKAEADKAAMTELDRAKAEAAEVAAAAAKDRAEAAAERLAAKLERRLVAAGIDDKALARAVRTIALDADATDDDIDSEIAALKTDVPGMFPTAGTPVPDKKPTGAPTPPKGGQTGTSPREQAHAILRRLGQTPRNTDQSAA